MAMAALPRRESWTAADWEAFEPPADGYRYELLDGSLLVTPSPSPVHQSAVLCVRDVLEAALRLHGGGRVLVAPMDLPLADDTVLQPDVLVLFPRPASAWNVKPRAHEVALVVEVMSPSTRRLDRETKRRRYLEGGLAEIWVVDTTARHVERWVGDAPATVHATTLPWGPPGSAEVVEIDLVTLFARAWGEC